MTAVAEKAAVSPDASGIVGNDVSAYASADQHA